MDRLLYINEKKLSVYSQKYILHHENYHGLSYNGHPILEIENEKIMDAIKEIESTGKYGNISILAAIKDIDKKEEIRLQEECKNWDKIHAERIRLDVEKAERKKKIEEYVKTVLSMKYPYCVLVYNRLDETIEKHGVFIICVSGRWINIPISEAL